jgi:hypothetical protein
MSQDEDDPIPRGVCTAISCKCSCFDPLPSRPMYCAQPECQHSVEWHHLNAKEIDA